MTQTQITGLPENLRTVPTDRQEWLVWRDLVLAYRRLIHLKCEHSPESRDLNWHLASIEPAYDMCMFGVIFEPRRVKDWHIDGETGEEAEYVKPAGWYPWIPYEYQVRNIQWVEDIYGRVGDPLGRGDGVEEKPRDVGASWSYCEFFAHQWLYADNFLGHCISYKEELVSKQNDPRSIFFKIRSLIGLNRKVPERAYAPGTPYHNVPVRRPDWQFPKEWDPKEHDMKLALTHPTKNNIITGESTTARSGTGGRYSALFVDEAAKIEELDDLLGGISATCDHIYLNSSADLRFGRGFFDRARLAERVQSTHEQGPSYFRVNWWDHPLRGDDWYQGEKARNAHRPDFFAREYDINYFAGQTGVVYDYARQMQTGHFPFDPISVGRHMVSVDPAIRDPTALANFQHDPGRNRWRLYDALLINTPTAEFLAPLLTGLPPEHPLRHQYAGNPDALEYLDASWERHKLGLFPFLIGDPYGKHAGGAGKTTYYGTLFEFGEKLHEGVTGEFPGFKEWGVPEQELWVHSNYVNTKLAHIIYKDAMGKFLPTLDINGTARPRAALEALRQSVYRPQAEGVSRSNEPQDPLHDINSHWRTTIEFMAYEESRGLGFYNVPERQETKDEHKTDLFARRRKPRENRKMIPQQAAD
jgi:hypothetical protein